MTDQTLFAALDVSLKKTSVCILDRDGRTVLEAVVASEPEALSGLSARQGVPPLAIKSRKSLANPAT